MKQIMCETGACFGGELSGHYYFCFPAGYVADDGAAAMMRLGPIATLVLAVAAGCVGPPRRTTVAIGDGLEMEMVLIPGGTFVMGSPRSEEGRDDDEGPAHTVTITRPFYIGKCEVTQAQWRAVMGWNPSRMQNPLVTAPDSPDDMPVEQVSWDMAQEFLKRLNRKVPGGGFRLPTEAEWEYAARAGSTTRFSFGDEASRLGDYAWYRENSESLPHPVGLKKPNPWGLHDVHGNAMEWCLDEFRSYKAGHQVDPRTEYPASVPVLRGGSWEDPPGECRSAWRLHTPAPDSGDGIGLRIVRTIPEPRGWRQFMRIIAAALVMPAMAAGPSRALGAAAPRAVEVDWRSVVEYVETCRKPYWGLRPRRQ